MSHSSFKPESLPDLKGKVFLVTGGNAGIGKTTVIGLASHGATVYMGARNEAKALSVIENIKQELPNADIRHLQLDLSNLQSVVDAAKYVRKNESVLNGLVNNAGIMGVPFSQTSDGFEIQLQTNYLAHWLLTHHLMPLLLLTVERSGPGSARVVNVTSDGHMTFTVKDGIQFDDMSLGSQSAMVRYGHSKLAQILHIKELNKRHGPNTEQNCAGVWFAAVHPGHIDTDLNLQATGAAPSFVLRIATPIMRCLGILDDQAKGAISSLFAIASEEFGEKNSGAYVVPYSKIGKPSKAATDSILAIHLWNWTFKQVESKGLLIETE